MQITTFYGEAETDDPLKVNCGWIEIAQHKVRWKANEQDFIVRMCL